ncbi:MAG: homocysteine S-methyltransferase family protein [Alistipes sp.]|nr:homocysteine S-methyltransferase family protein [Alistipes sp.]
MALAEDLRRRILLLDGAMGTMLLDKGIKGCLELANVEQADVVADVHRAYLQAGADIITTNTTCADALCLNQYGLSERARELAKAGAELARRVADEFSTTLQPRYVAGSVGPTTRNLTLANDVTAEELAATYADVIGGLIEGGVDLILIETAMDAANVRIAIEECRKINSEIPIVVSAVLSRIAGRVASGATIDKFLEDIPLDEVSIVGFNCSNGVKTAEESLKMLAAKCDKPLILYPSAGQPVVAANRFAKEMEALCRAGLLNIVGGCCGTTPAYTETMAKMVQRWRPRKTGKN